MLLEGSRKESAETVGQIANLSEQFSELLYIKKRGGAGKGRYLPAP